MNQQFILFFINIYEKKIVSVKISSKSFDKKKFPFFLCFFLSGGDDKKKFPLVVENRQKLIKFITGKLVI